MKLLPFERLILSLDLNTDTEALSLLENLQGELAFCKVGLQLFTRYGIGLLHKIKKMNFRIFLDLKFHDIPNTVSAAIQSLSEVEIDLLNMHAMCGSEGLAKARDTLSQIHPNAKLFAVTVLTSLNDSMIHDMGIQLTAKDLVMHLCRIAAQSGLDGVVCSAQEASMIKTEQGKSFLTICPGIRRLSDKLDDQQRVTTPSQAMNMGADWIVVGRPILKAISPRQEVIEIIKEIEKGLTNE